MRRLFMLSCVVAFLSGGCSWAEEAKEPLNILDLTLNMTVDEIYEKIEKNKDSLGIPFDTSSREAPPRGNDIGYHYKLFDGDRDRIRVIAASPEPSQRPFVIRRNIYISYKNEEEFKADDVFKYTEETLVKKFGKPAYKAPEDVRRADVKHNDVLWTADKGANIKKCGDFSKMGSLSLEEAIYMESSIVRQSMMNDGCEHILHIKLSERFDKQERRIYMQLTDIRYVEERVGDKAYGEGSRNAVKQESGTRPKL